MLTKENIIIVQVSDQMILDGVHYAEKSLHYTFNRMGSSNMYDRVRNIVKGLIMESAFKHLLDHHHVKYDLLGNTHWTKKDRYDVGLDGHRYDIKGYFIGGPNKVSSVKKDPAWLLDCCALVPSDQINAKSLKADDCYVFPFIVGDLDRTQGRTLFDKQRHKYLIYAFWDYKWIKNKDWQCIGHLKVTSRMNEPIHLRLGGQDVDKESIVDEFDLQPGEVYTTSNEYFTVLFLQTSDIPTGTLVVTCPKKNQDAEISPNNWGNIWFYDCQVFFTGYLSKGEFKRNSTEIPRFYKKCKQYGETKTVNRMLQVKQLDPVNLLL